MRTHTMRRDTGDCVVIPCFVRVYCANMQSAYMLYESARAFMRARSASVYRSECRFGECMRERVRAYMQVCVSAYTVVS